MSDDLRHDFIESLKIGDHSLESVERGGSLEVADVLAEKDLAASGQRHDILLVRTHRQDRRQLRRHAHRQRRIAAGTSEETRLAPHEEHQAVIGVPLDRPVVNEQLVCAGRIPRVDEIIGWMREVLNAGTG